MLILTLFFVSTFSASEELLPLKSYLHSLDERDYIQLESKDLKRSFHIYLKLPKGYKNSKEKYPVIYLLDGGITFPLLASYHQYLFLAEDVPEAIIVGIAYPGTDFKSGNMRSTDFTAPAESRDYWGGADKFQSFLERDLIRVIESRYPADPDKRIIFGQSLGGQFVLYSALTKPNLFWGHIASNPALHRNLAFFTVEKSNSPLKKSKLYVSSGSLDDSRFRKPATQWIDFWENRKSKPWQLKTETLVDENHFSAAPKSYRNGLKWIFEQ